VTVTEVQKWLDSIAACARDDEAAHSSEDSLYEAVLRAIADGRAEDPREMARLALSSGEIEFARWCA
jgi:hypothetical protein